MPLTTQVVDRWVAYFYYWGERAGKGVTKASEMTGIELIIILQLYGGSRSDSDNPSSYGDFICATSYEARKWKRRCRGSSSCSAGDRLWIS